MSACATVETGDIMPGRKAQARKAAEAANGVRWCLGAAYEPHIRTQDVRSSGRKSRFTYHGRPIHTLSDLEVRAFRHFQWDLAVFGIEEQYYLEIEDTVRIAEEAGARHPTDPGTSVLFEMSTDLVIYCRADRGDRRIARSIKYAKDLELGSATTSKESRRIENILGKLEIERRYWAERNVPWAVLTEHELSEVRQRNIEHMLGSELDASRPDGFWQDAANRVCDVLVAGDGSTVVELQRLLHNDGSLDAADFMACFRHLCATRQLVFDMEEKFSLVRPVSDFAFAKPPLKLVA